MRLRHGPRPTAIRAFALLFLLQASAAFWYQMEHLPALQTTLTSRFPEVAINRDLMIVLISARLTIAIIPVALIWLLASRVSRILVQLLVVLRLSDAPVALDLARSGELLFAGSLVLMLGAGMLLLSPDAASWFRRPPGERTR